MVVRVRIAIQGELGSNSHMAAIAMRAKILNLLRPVSTTDEVEVIPCSVSAEVLARVLDGAVDGAVLPIENSLHGSVAEHYDLLHVQPVRMVAEGLMRIEHNVIGGPGVRLADVRRVLSHPVALSQCREWFRRHPEIEAVPFYDTAGGVKHVMQQGQRDTAAIAPRLAARVYSAEVMESGVEDNQENYTRFHLVVRDDREVIAAGANKLSLAFSIDHQPGTLVAALERLAVAGVNLTKIESRPVPGRPWEYVFYVDVRFRREEDAAVAVDGLRRKASVVKELGRYVAAEGLGPEAPRGEVPGVAV
jgi:prephenate dehydratase